MAKLSARGRSELFRLEKRNDNTEDKEILYSKTSLSFMSDGSILRKLTIKYIPLYAWEKTGRLNDYGWKTFQKVKKGGDITGVFDRMMKFYQEKGYIKV